MKSQCSCSCISCETYAIMKRSMKKKETENCHIVTWLKVTLNIIDCSRKKNNSVFPVYGGDDYASHVIIIIWWLLLLIQHKYFHNISYLPIYPSQSIILNLLKISSRMSLIFSHFRLLSKKNILIKQWKFFKIISETFQDSFFILEILMIFCNFFLNQNFHSSFWWIFSR